MEQILKRSWRWQPGDPPPSPKCSSKESEKEDEDTEEGEGKSDGGQPDDNESSEGGNTEEQEAKEQPAEDKPTEQPEQLKQPAQPQARKPSKNRRLTREAKVTEARAKLEQLLLDDKIKTEHKMPAIRQLLNTIYGSYRDNKKEKEEIGIRESDYDVSSPLTRGREPERGIFDPKGRLKTLIDDQLNHLTDEQLTGRYTHILQNAFYAMVERIGTDTCKLFDTRASDNMKYNMRELTARVVTKKPLSKCKEYLTKEQIFLFTDSSGSCSGVSKIINSVSQIVSYRGDCVLLVSPDCGFLDTSHYLTREERQRKVGSKRYIVNEPPFVSPKFNKGQERLFKHHKGGYYGIQEWFDIERLKDKTLIMLTDADAYSKLPSLLATGVKKIIFLDLFNYVLSRGGSFDRENCILHMQTESPGQYRRYVSSIQAYQEDLFNMLEQSGERITSCIIDDNLIFNPNVLLSKRFQWHYVYDATDLLKILHTIK